MVTKQVIQRSQQFNPAVWNVFTIPEFPMVYSLKYPIGKRTLDMKYFRKKAYASLMKCQMPAFVGDHGTKPLVLRVRFYVPPFVHKNVPQKDVVTERVPAKYSYELCDYLLALLELLHKVLLDNYKDICKVECEKYYSNNPRTEFQFMTWENYGRLLNNDSLDPKSKSKRKARSSWSVQPEQSGDAKSKKVRSRKHVPEKTAHWATICADPLCVPCADLEKAGCRKGTVLPDAPCTEAGCGQPGEVPQ